MPATQRVYKVDKTEVEKDVALLEVIGETDEAKAIRGFCQRYSIPLDKAAIKLATDGYEVVARALQKNKK